MDHYAASRLTNPSSSNIYTSSPRRNASIIYKCLFSIDHIVEHYNCFRPALVEAALSTPPLLRHNYIIAMKNYQPTRSKAFCLLGELNYTHARENWRLSHSNNFLARLIDHKETLKYTNGCGWC